MFNDKKILLRLTVCLFTIMFYSCSNSERDSFIDDLMSKMTLEEKIGQLNLPSAGDVSTGELKSTDISSKIREGQVGGLFNLNSVEKIKEIQRIAVEESRLKIPIIFGMDVIHGFKTIFPIPLGLSCSWDMDIVEKVAEISAKEATSSGINWTFSPMVDISRDPRWGRVSEGSGEDPYLGAQIAKAMVRGYQGKNLKDNSTLISCVKHFALYGAAEAGRDYNTTDMSRVRMYNEYFLPYKAAIDAGAKTVMTSFNEVDGVPASANKWLMDEVLRKQWGFDGFVVTDYTAINEMVNHGLGDLKYVSKLALEAGVDMDMVGEGYVTYLKKLVQEGKLLEKLVDNSCRKILEVKYDLGLFEDPYRYCDLNRSKTEVFSKTHRSISREIAAESFVLLKNNNDLLPLNKKQKIALVGPMAKNKENMVGTWCVNAMPKKSISLLDALKKCGVKESNIKYARGANFVSDPNLEKRFSVFGKDTYRDKRSEKEMIKEAVSIANQSDVVVAAIGEAAEMSGESSSRSNIELPSSQRNLLKALKKTGKPIVVVLFTGRPLDLRWEKENINSILNVWFPGSEGGLAIADALYGNVVPSGKLTLTFPQNVGQIPLYYNAKNTGRPLGEDKWFKKFRSNYLDISNDPLYPFGYGLSYSHFEYPYIELDKKELGKDDVINATLMIRNIGNYDAKEVVQLYIRDKYASITRPVKELKAFKKVFIKAGESANVEFKISARDLAFWNNDIKFVAEKGEFDLFIGTNSNDCKTESFVLNEDVSFKY
jgi:beta-glucosidase